MSFIANILTMKCARSANRPNITVPPYEQHYEIMDQGYEICPVISSHTGDDRRRCFAHPHDHNF